jgi:hypothetical protein
MRASNALLNYSKTQAISLSGAPLPSWQDFLTTHHITNWHDRRSPLPLIYLGFAICTSIHQRDQFFQQMCNKIRQQCFIHAQRRLSIRGRATVLNTLIYSTLWHVMRIFTFNQTQLKQIQSIGSSFINHKIYPRLSLTTISLPRQSGGLGILNPMIQQHSFQWRWVSLLLQTKLTATLVNTLPSLPLVKYAFHWFYSSPQFPSYHWSLLFPRCRASHWLTNFIGNNSLNNIFVNFFNAIDSLPKTFVFCHTTAFTCLSLPFLEIVQSYLPTPRAIDQAVGPDKLIPGHPGLKTLLATDVFTFDFGSQTIRTRERHGLQRSPGVSQYAINLFKNNYLIPHAFFFAHILKGPRSADHSGFRSIDLTSFCHSFFRPAILPLSQPPPINSIEHYKSLISTKTSSIPLMSPKQWKNFWKIKFHSLHVQSGIVLFTTRYQPKSSSTNISNQNIPHQTVLFVHLIFQLKKH